MMDENARKQDPLRRFSPPRIVEHWVILAVFLALVATGLSQRYCTLDLSRQFILHLGGIDNVRFFHRMAGAFFAFVVTVHIILGIIGIVVRRWQPSMVITKKDFIDIVRNIRYYLGLEEVPARGGRYTYKQKFEYWGILTSALLMILTGAILWFPVHITHYFPGEVIPAAKVMHANQALLAFLIIALWHVYNAVFSPDVFPLDASIFTGSISRERMLEEHPEELAELEERNVEELLASSSPRDNGPDGRPPDRGE